MAHIKQVDLAVNNTTTSYLIEPTLYGTATVSNSGALYTVTFPEGFELANGICVQVGFPDTNANDAQLNNKYIYYNGDKLTAGFIKANHIYDLVYNGNIWYIVGVQEGTTYSAGTGLTLSNGQFNVIYGSTAGTAVQGDDSRLSDARTPTSHTHGNITNDGKVGSGNNLLKTVSGEVQAGPAIISTIANQNQSTRFLREDGSWSAPEYTTNTDVAVAQNGVQDNYDYPILFKYSYDFNSVTNGVKFAGNADKAVTINPNTGIIKAQGFDGTSSAASTVPWSGVTGAEDLAAIELLNTTGYLKRTGTHTWILDSTNFTDNTGTVTEITIETTAPLSGGSNTKATTVGSWTIGIDDQEPHYVLAGPSTGTANHNPSQKGAATFRALELSDLPLIEVNKGGTGITSCTIGSILYGSDTNVFSTLAGNTTTTHKFLRSAATTNGTAAAPSWVQLEAADIPNLSWNKITSDKPTTLSGYGITDAKIASNIITLGSNTIKPVTSVNGHEGPTVTITATDLGLSAALRFKGITTTDMTGGNLDAHSYTGVPGGITDYTTPAIGDVVINSTNKDEWVCITANGSSSVWERLGADSSWALSNHVHGNITNDGKMSGSTVTGAVNNTQKFLREDGTWVVPSYTVDHDSKVQQSISSTNNNYPILFSTKTTIDNNNGNPEEASRNNNIYVNPSTGYLYATKFIGPIEGTVTGNVEGTATGINGILPVSQGGTGVDNFTGDSIIMSGSNDTGKTTSTKALVTRSITNSGSATAITTSTNIPTMNTIYYGLPTINDAHDYNSSTNFYVADTAGISGQIFLSNGNNTTSKKPVWSSTATLDCNTSNTANQTAYTTLTLGNSAGVATTTAHSEGQIKLYSESSGSHIIKGSDTGTAEQVHTLPNTTGYLVSTSTLSSIGSNTQGIFINSSGIVQGIQYTPNRLYHSGAAVPNQTYSVSFQPTNHYADDDKIAIGMTSWPTENSSPSLPSSYSNVELYINKEIYITSATTHKDTVYFGSINNNINADGNAKLATLGLGTTVGNNYILNISGNAKISGTFDFASSTYINNLGVGKLNSLGINVDPGDYILKTNGNTFLGGTTYFNNVAYYISDQGITNLASTTVTGLTINNTSTSTLNLTNGNNTSSISYSGGTSAKLIFSCTTGAFEFNNNIIPTATTNTKMIGDSTHVWTDIYATTLHGNATSATTATTANSATKATQDANGDTIHTTYLKLSGGDMTGTLKLYGLKGTLDIDYGPTFPSTGLSLGRLFFQTGTPIYELPAGGTTGQALIKNSATDRDVTWGAVGGIMNPVDTSTSANAANYYYVTCSSSASTNADPAVFDVNIYVKNGVLFGAAWNDYAEYRQCTDYITPGHCIIENGDGTLSQSTKRLQAGAEIVSDTFGFAIGQTEKCNTPIAVSGRVLAYINEPLEEIKIGAPVCSGPHGTVSQMTQYEARKYPWCIIGTISAIPQEETWGAKNIKVNGRIWIRVR